MWKRSQALHAMLVALSSCAALLTASAHASENQVTGYLVDRAAIEAVVGSGDEALVARIVKTNRFAAEGTQHRFSSWADYNEVAPTTPQAALRELISGKLDENHDFEYHCLTEWVLRTLGTEIEDRSPRGSLNTFIDLWLDGPDRMMAELGWETLHLKWLVSRSPLGLTAEVEWPVVTAINYAEAQQILAEAEASPPEQLRNFAADLFEGRGDELSLRQLRRVHLETLQELLRWVAELESDHQLLVILVDGDQ